ncbi:MAG TPA: ATP-binding protein [Chloroflexota bacterium]|nr:ATP-binding protein [Chloroflexota bacterium]
MPEQPATEAVETRAQSDPYQAILDAAPEGILRIDLNGRIAYANRSAAVMLGLSVAELLDRPLRSYIQFLSTATGPGPEHTDDGAINVAGLTLLPLGQDSAWRENGTSFPVEYEAAPLHEDGRSLGAVVTFRDVTGRRSAEVLKDELIALTSHELRSPLTSIRSALGLLAAGHGGLMPPQGQRMFEIAVANTDRLIRLVNDLLDLERIDAGHVRITRVPCRVGELLSQSADGMRPIAQDAGVAIQVIPNDARVSGDPDRLLQVLTNLLANAIKFSPHSGGTVWLDAEATAAEVVIRVRDEGRGIPTAKLETIFDRFVQVDAGDAREKGGTGLGLAISRSIVKQHGGQIWAESTVGVGTILCVALPYHSADSARLAA